MKIDTNNEGEMDRIMGEIKHFVPEPLLPALHEGVKDAADWLSALGERDDEALLRTFVGVCCLMAARFPSATEPAENAALRILMSLRDEEDTNG